MTVWRLREVEHGSVLTLTGQHEGCLPSQSSAPGTSGRAGNQCLWLQGVVKNRAGFGEVSLWSSWTSPGWKGHLPHLLAPGPESLRCWKVGVWVNTGSCEKQGNPGLSNKSVRTLRYLLAISLSLQPRKAFTSESKFSIETWELQSGLWFKNWTWFY